MNSFLSDHTLMRRSSPLAGAALFCFALIAVPTTSLAQITASFDGGNSSAVVDAWQGKAGDGWAGGWAFSSNNDTTVNSTVTSATPLTGGSGNYLSSSFEIASGSAVGNRAYAIRRAYEADLSAMHEISFLYRLDALNNSGRVDIYDDTRGVKSVSGTPLLTSNASTTWNITASKNGDWGAINGAVTTIVTAGVKLFDGDVYAFNVELNPTENEYRFTVENLDFATNGRSLGSASFTSTWLKFANQTGEVHGQLVVAGRVYNSNAEFSLDSIAITQVPEPAHSGGWFAAMAVLWAVARRRARTV